MDWLGVVRGLCWVTRSSCLIFGVTALPVWASPMEPALNYTASTFLDVSDSRILLFDLGSRFLFSLQLGSLFLIPFLLLRIALFFKPRDVSPKLVSDHQKLSDDEQRKRQS